MATETTTELPPRTLPPVRFVDVGTKKRVRTGGYTVVGSGYDSRIVETSGISQEEAQRLEAQREAERQATAERQRQQQLERERQQQRAAEERRRREVITTRRNNQSGIYRGTFTVKPAPKKDPEYTIRTEQELPPKEIRPSRKITQQEVARKLPPRERVVQAYQSAGKTRVGEPSFRGATRAFLEVSEIIGEKIGFQFGGRVPSTTVENVALFTFFSPATATSGQIYRAVQPTIVKFSGSQQTISGSRVATATKFTATRGGATTKGVAGTITRVYGAKGGGVFVSATKGTTFRRGIDVFGRGVTQRGTIFKAGEVGTLSSRGELIFQRGYGLFGTTPFRSGFIGKQTGERVVSIGVSTSRLGYGVAAGTVKNVGSSPINFIFTGGGATTTLSKATLGRVGLASAQSSVSATVQKQPVVLGVQSIGGLLSSIRTRRSPTSTPPPQQTQEQIRVFSTPIQTQAPSQDVSLASASVAASASAQTQQTRQQQIVSPKLTQTQVQQPRQRQLATSSLALKQITRQRTQTVPSFSFSFPKIPRPPPILPPLRLRRGKGGETTGTASVFLRRFGKFRPIAVGVPASRAINIGRRAASTTLAATFRVEGVSEPIKIPRFRTKRTKRGQLFIELPKYRLSTRSERREIQSFRR